MATGTIKSTAWQLLWTNPNPSSNFANDTDIPLDLTLYSELCVVCRSETGSDSAEPCFMLIMPPAYTSAGQSTGLQIYTMKFYQRYATRIYSDHIHIGKGCWFNSYGSRTDGTKYCIPLYIYAR